jgi:hypothetical protein
MYKIDNETYLKQFEKLNNKSVDIKEDSKEFEELNKN